MIEKPLIMGILNLTPDSFSDGGKYQDIERAVLHAEKMVSDGADIIDIGGESTRPGADRISAKAQKHRVIDICKILHETLGDKVYLSIDTTRSEVAKAVLNAGVGIVNDISAGRDDSNIFPLCADHEAKLILMHMQGTPKTMQNNPHYDDVVTEVKDFLSQRLEIAMKAGIAENNLMIDPGIGFGKNTDHNLCLLSALDDFVAMGFPVVLGVSRKRFMGSRLGDQDANSLLQASCATTALGVRAGVKVFRVHDIQPHRQTADIVAEIMKSSVSY